MADLDLPKAPSSNRTVLLQKLCYQISYKQSIQNDKMGVLEMQRFKRGAACFFFSVNVVARLFL